MSVLQNSVEFGKRVAAARGYMGEKKPGFAKAMGSSVPTVTRWEEGAIGSIGATVLERRQLAERVVEVTGCPPDWFELSEPPSSQAVDELRRAVAALATLVTTPDLDLAARQLLENELGAARQWSTSIPPIEAPGSA